MSQPATIKTVAITLIEQGGQTSVQSSWQNASLLEALAILEIAKQGMLSQQTKQGGEDDDTGWTDQAGGPVN